MDDRTPILIGAGQLTQRDVDFREAKEPAELMAAAARLAAADAGGDGRLLDQVDRLVVVNIIGWAYANAPAVVAERLGVNPAQLIYTTVGGNTPQWLVHQTADRIVRGETRMALLTGAEAMGSFARARKAKFRLPWSTNGAGSPTVVGTDRSGINDLEMGYGLMLPIATYPLFENALRHHYGRSIAEHQRCLGELCSSFTKVAAGHPHAWFPQERSPEELATVTAENRYIGFPYPKRMNSILEVDQSAAILMTSVGTARELGIDPSRWVYLWGGGDASDIWHVSERVNYYSSPAIQRAGAAALEMAGVTIDEIAHLDIYSCFPSAVQIGRDMLGIAHDDPRPLTVTGGLPYHGGPGNNYVMHSIATMMDRLRGEPESRGLVTGLGWYATKHSVGVYGGTPPPQLWRERDDAGMQAAIDAMPHPKVVAVADGPATVETYTVLFDREGAPMRGLVIGRLDDGSRFLANTPPDPTLLDTMTRQEMIGTRGAVTHIDGSNVFTA